MRNWWKILLIALGAVLLVLLIGFVFSNGFGVRPGIYGYRMMGPGMMRGYFPFGFGIFGLLMMLGWLFIPLILIVAIVLGVISLVRGSRSVPVQPAATQTCPNCGRSVQSGWVACPYCGQNLKPPVEPGQ